MKKILSISVVIILSLSAVMLAGYAVLRMQTTRAERITASWQTVAISGLGTFRVPAEWNVEEEDGILFITDQPRADGAYEIYILGRFLGMVYQAHEVFEGVEVGDQLHSTMFRNGGGVRVFGDRVHGIKQEHRVISFNAFGGGARRDYWMNVLNCEVVDEWHTEQIARTYRANRHDFNNSSAGRLMP